jgi:hypothetical protein
MLPSAIVSPAGKTKRTLSGCKVNLDICRRYRNGADGHAFEPEAMGFPENAAPAPRCVRAEECSMAT